MNYSLSPELREKLGKIKRRDIQLLKKIQKQLSLFQQNPTHSSLRVHKLSGKLDNIWSMSIDTNVRMVYLLEAEGVYFFDIGTHDQIYRK